MTDSAVDVQRMPERGLTEAQKRGSSLLWFSEIDSSHLGVAGGKGANLGEMIRRGAPVPPGFVVSVVAYRRFLAGSGLDVKLGEILSSFNIYRTSVLLDVAARAQQAILDAPMPRNSPTKSSRRTVRWARAPWLSDRPRRLRTCRTPPSRASSAPT